MSDELLHYGTKRHSGRYPWGSGKDPQRSFDFLSFVDQERAKGLSDVEIAKSIDVSTTEFRKQVTIANHERREIVGQSVYAKVDRGMNNTEIAKELGISEGTVRNYIKNRYVVKTKQLDNIAAELKAAVDKYGYLDVGPGVEIQMGISRDKLKAAVKMVKEQEGLESHKVYLKRLQNNSQSLTLTVLTKEKDIGVVLKNTDKVRPIQSSTEDGGLTFKKVRKPKSIDWDRIDINYGDKGGEEKDGVIELRRGVDDLSLGTKRYAQVRIAVDGTHYLKGMAVYADDLPDGVDVRFNTNKPSGTPREKVLKPLKGNDFNPFGATIQKQRGAINIVNEEGDWNTWSTKLSAQFLSKQPKSLVKERLDITYDELEAEYKVLQSLTNPVVKKHMMASYADGLESKARHLKVKGMPKTKSHVILPFPDMNPNEVYAPKYKDGERVVLIRYPHGGKFEIPELVVNNKGPARKKLGNAEDAIGIHPTVAKKLSGADFDGDTVSVIPNPNKKIKTSRALDSLQNFDPVQSYQVPDDSPKMLRKKNPKTGKMESIGLTITPDNKQREMGIVSNLITDMTIKGASDSELARAVRHSMVVIDSEKHKLDYKQSAIDNGISALQNRYQTHYNPVKGKTSKGASTIVSQSKSVVEKVTGPKAEEYAKKVLKDTGKKLNVVKGIDIPLIDYVSDVGSLSSGTAVEEEYVGYIKKVKSLTNDVRKKVHATKTPKRDPEASKKYAAEVDSLEKKLNVALLNAPKERQAQIMATSTYHRTLKEMNYDMDKDQKKKLKSQAVADARQKTGAEKKLVDITDKEWEAIQNNAISPSKLSKILNNADMEKVQKLALPKQESVLSVGKLNKAYALLNNGYTYAQVAESLGVSVSTLGAELIGKDDDNDLDD